MLDKSEKDFLTDCFAKSELLPFLDESIGNSKKNNKPFSIALIDLDRFKKLNYKFGHLYGDDILKYVASTVRLTLEDKGYLFRYGGDEFVAVFPEKSSKEAAQLARQCSNNLAHRPFLYKEKLHKITISVGIADFPSDGNTKYELISRADKAMYMSKNYGRNLITEAHRITYIRWRNTAMAVASVLIVSLTLHLLSGYGLLGFFKKMVKSVQAVKVVSEGAELVTVIKKDGTMFEGRILGETDDFVIINFKLERGSASINIDKDEIAEIKFSPKKDRDR
ncbi:MAG: GGDEF domain-containing protein [Candidatus Omnitrophica bacterium]|nr:GGDEF domain-containing protein [Candidatus Omnitrophota bacterium]